ncbi:methylated-DNA--[protein]-cysteine S-methyltransferase [Chloroflexota bacterium]
MASPMTDEELKYVVFDTDAGWAGVLGSANGLLRTTLPQGSSQEAHRLLGDKVNQASWSPRQFDNLIDRLRAYFSGHKAPFPDKLDLSGATPFQRKVWEKTRLIPYGEIRSYSWVAEQIEKPGASRAVGQALGKNTLPIIVPCHRVLASSGKLGGFTGGLDMKAYLLSLETQNKVECHFL